MQAGLAPCRVAGGDGLLGGLDQETTPLRLDGQARGTLQQVGGDSGGAAGVGDPTGLGEGGGDAGIGPLDGRCQVDGAFDRVVGGVGQRATERPALPRRRVRVGRRAEQRMRRPDPCPIEAQDASLEGLVEGRVAGRAEHSSDEARGRLAGHRHDDDGAPRVAAQRREVVAHERTRFGRDGERFARRGFEAASLERAADLQAKERVARARFVEPGEQRPRMRHVEALVDEPAEGAHRQGTHDDPRPTVDRVVQRGDRA